MKAYAITHPGLVRPNNEDSFLSDPEGGLFIVADGMGGHAGGEVASQLAVDTVALALADGPPNPDRVAAAFVRASHAISERIDNFPELKGMGTTLTLAVVRSDSILIGHIGDSRAYLIGPDAVSCLTSDHTVTSQLLAAGKISKDEAQNHPQRHVLTRVLGPVTESGADVGIQPWQPGQYLLLCSDGLSSLLRDEELGIILNTSLTLEQRGQALLSAALERGAPDNATLILVNLSALQEGRNGHDRR